MKELIKLMLLIGAVFALIFIIVKFSGLLSMEQIESWLVLAKEASPLHVAFIVATLLIFDLFLSVPTMPLTMLAGYFLGHIYGASAVLFGLLIAGMLGYFISRYFGVTILNLLVKTPEKRNEVITTFNKHGFIMIILARAVPMLPEVTACLAGITRMPFLKFLLAWSISAVPYTLIVAYSGSISSLHDPSPIFITAIGVWCSLWLGWFLFQRSNRVKARLKK